MEADKKYLADLTATCEQKATDFESRQQLRAEELEAITKATCIDSWSVVVVFPVVSLCDDLRASVVRMQCAYMYLSCAGGARP